MSEYIVTLNFDICNYIIIVRIKSTKVMKNAYKWVQFL